MKSKFLKKSLAVALTLSVVAPAMVIASNTPGEHGQKKGHVKEHPLGKKQNALKAKALEAKLKGNAFGKTHEVARGQFVELEREGEDLIWTVLTEFSNLAHNSIPQPDRSVNNSTIWTDDFSRDHYMNILFNESPGANSMRNFYIEQSSNRYTVDGDVTDWVTVPGNAEEYDDDISGGVWNLIEDSVTGWYNQMAASGMTDAEIAAEMAKYDVWDRYDYDGDGNFDEPDGYIDHFQIVHAGEGEEAGGGELGGAAIWSHRWYARFGGIGSEGPAGNLLGGVEIPGTGLWIGDYTVEPENGGVGVFAHEFAHDHGLPDLYDTGGGENSTGFWTLMSSGSWLNNGTSDIGSMPGHMGGWEKFQLGWYNYEVAFAGEASEHKLGPAEATTKHAAQGVFVVLPDKLVTEEIGSPFEGEKFYYSGAGDDLDNRMYTSATLTGSETLYAMVNYSIEVDWDYAYAIISTDGGTTWENLQTDHSTMDDPNGQNFGWGIMGSTGGAWVPLTADLSAYTGDVLIGFRYWTDGAYVEPGFMVDNIQIGMGPVYGAEMDEGWTLEGFRTSTGTESGAYFNAYLAENRVYRGFDANLALGPYNFGFQDQLGDWVERFPYQDGLLVSYWDTSYTDNNVSAHPGGGLILPVDAHPEPMYRADGGLWRPRIQSYDSTFSIEDTDALTLHWNSEASYHPSLPGARAFNDLYDYWTAANPYASVMVPKTGTEIYIHNTSAQGNFMKVKISPVQ